MGEGVATVLIFDLPLEGVEVLEGTAFAREAVDQGVLTLLPGKQVWQEAEIPPDEAENVLVTVETGTDMLQGPFTLTLWAQGGTRACATSPSHEGLGAAFAPGRA